MTVPSLPTGYDETRHVQAGRSECHITIGFDQQRFHIPKFIVQLHYQTATNPVLWTEIARMDHNETSITGHDVYNEGLHVDVARQTKASVHLQVTHSPLPASRGTVIRRCAEYLADEASYFSSVYEERRPPGSPPGMPDGGEPPPELINEHLLSDGMSQESPVEDPLSLEELSEVLAEATGTTADEIEHGAAEIEIAPPSEATVIDE